MIIMWICTGVHLLTLVISVSPVVRGEAYLWDRAFILSSQGLPTINLTPEDVRVSRFKRLNFFFFPFSAAFLKIAL